MKSAPLRITQAEGETVSVHLREVESALQALERQLAEDERRFRRGQPATRSAESLLISLVLTLLLLCAGTAIVGARFLMVHGSEVFHQFSGKNKPAELAR